MFPATVNPPPFPVFVTALVQIDDIDGPDSVW
jgi:hypothetical protein